jgi:hypothetical protein
MAAKFKLRMQDPSTVTDTSKPLLVFNLHGSGFTDQPLQNVALVNNTAGLNGDLHVTNAAQTRAVVRIFANALPAATRSANWAPHREDSIDGSDTLTYTIVDSTPSDNQAVTVDLVPGDPCNPVV